MGWFILTLLSVFIVSISNILLRILMRDENSEPVSYTIIFALLLSCVYFIVSLFLGFHFPVLDWKIIYFLIAATLWGLGTIFLFKALQIIESSEVTILVSLRILITITASVIFLHDVFNFQKFIGTIILLLSILLVANIKKGIKFNKGVTYSIFVIFFSGLAVVFDAYNLNNYDVVSYLAVINFLIFVVLLTIRPKAILKWKQFTHPGFLKKMLPLVLFSCGQAYAYYFALQKGPLSQIAPISQSQVIVTVLFAAVLLNEKDNLLRKIIAAVLVTIGVILLR